MNIQTINNTDFFKAYFAAVKETYTEYCQLKEREEGLVGYREPDYQLAMTEAKRRVENFIDIDEEV